MENSLDSSSPISDRKSLFKNSTNFHQAFEVSLEESVTAAESNKSEQGLDSSNTGSKKVLPFKKTRKSIQHPFSITSDESIVDSESEESVTFKKPQSVFSKKNKTLTEFFNVSFNETNVSRADAFGKSFDDSNTVFNKTNPFKRKNETPKEILVRNESSVAESPKESNSCAELDESHKEPTYSTNDESSIMLTKQNPFRMAQKQKRDSVHQLQVSALDEDNSVENEVGEPEIDKSMENVMAEPEVDNSIESEIAQPEIDDSVENEIAQPEIDITVGNEAGEPETDMKDESQVVVSSTQNDKSDVSLKKSRKRSMSETNFNEADSTTYNTKQNPFKKSNKRDSLTHLSVTNNSLGSRSGMQSNNSRENDEDLSIMESKLNPFKKSSKNCSSMISVTEERSKENSVLTNTERSQDISIDRNIERSVNNTVSYLHESSINDENLNNWMSDQSDEEIPPPRIPSVAANISQTREKPVISSPTNTISIWEQKMNEIVSNVENKRQALKLKMNSKTPEKSKQVKKPEQNVDKPVEKYKPPKLIKPAPFATKTLYNYIIKKMKPKYGIDTMLEAENLVSTICDTVKKVTRKKSHQKKLIQSLKKEMAEAGVIETTMDFYEFVINFLPHSFRVKVVPCVQPVTNIVYPPKDVMNPFDKIL